MFGDCTWRTFGLIHFGIIRVNSPESKGSKRGFLESFVEKKLSGLGSAPEMRCSVGGVEKKRREAGVASHSVGALSWKPDHRLTIVLCSTKFIRSSACVSARCQTQSEGGRTTVQQRLTN